jgi:ubiquinone/menaquinone biosynthesis C-methylase UbiE
MKNWIKRRPWYSQVIVPLLCDFGLDRPSVAKYRRELLSHASGHILEIGLGTGLNLAHYPKQVHKITTVDPNVGMYRRAQRRITQTAIEVDQRVLSSERLPFAENCFDCVVSTFTLCSIDNVSKALSEVHRVLKPGGKFLFLEHGLSPEPNIQKWQRRLNGLQIRLGGGCHQDRNMKELIAAQPFSSAKIEEFYLDKVPRTHGYIYRGIAME